MARDERVVFRMQADKKEQIQEIADEMGVTMSALLSVIVGQWLVQYNRVSRPMQDNIVQVMTDKFKDMSKEEIAGLMSTLEEWREGARA